MVFDSVYVYSRNTSLSINTSPSTRRILCTSSSLIIGICMCIRIRRIIVRIITIRRTRGKYRSIIMCVCVCVLDLIVLIDDRMCPCCSRVCTIRIRRIMRNQYSMCRRRCCVPGRWVGLDPRVRLMPPQVVRPTPSVPVYSCPYVSGVSHDVSAVTVEVAPGIPGGATGAFAEVARLAPRRGAVTVVGWVPPAFRFLAGLSGRWLV